MSLPPSDATSPSTLSIAIATAILGAVMGYMLGAGSSLNFTNSSASSAPKKSWPNSYDVDIHPDSSDEELMASLGRDKKSVGAGGAADADDSEDEEGGEGLKAFEDVPGECKLVLVVRTDLGMGKGKIAAQCGHATLACYTHLQKDLSGQKILRRWSGSGQAKIAVQCPNEEDLLTLQAQALSLGLCARVIHDAGRTQIAAGSATVLGVGPAPKSAVDAVTRGLKLL